MNPPVNPSSGSGGLSYTARMMNAVLDEFFACAPEAADALGEMQGKVIALRITGTDARFFFMPAGDSVRVMTAWPGKVDVTVTGGLFDLSQIMTRTRSDDINIEITGNADLGQRFMAVFTDADIVWGDIVARVIPDDVVAGFVERGVRDFLRAGRRVVESAGFSAGEFLREEARLLPDRYEVERFITQVDELRDACARLRVRLDNVSMRRAR